ncbi:MAG: site-specific integrase [Thermoplasmata archaeon]
MDFEKAIGRRLKTLTGENRDLLRRYEAEMRAAGLAVRTRLRQLEIIARLVDDLEKPLGEMDKADLVNWIASKELADTTMRVTVTIIRKFWKWMNGGEEYPPEVKGLKRNSIKKTDTLRSQDLLTEEEVLTLIQVSPLSRDKAILALLWDSGCRVGEILGMKVGDVQQHPRYPKALLVSVRESKIEPRELALFDCRPWVTRWLNEHPYREEPGQPLFVSLSKANYLGPLSAMGVSRIVRVAMERAKDHNLISKEKRVWVHLFRHSRASDLVSKDYHGEKLKQRMGWTMDSKMLARYIHLGSAASHDEDARIAGIEEEGTPKQSLMQETTCPVCATENPPGFKFCGNCSQPLTSEAATEVEEIKEDLVALVERLVEEKLREGLAK